MKLNDLIDALAAEIERAQPQLDQDLDLLARLQADDEAGAAALDDYSGLAQRMGEAAELAGFAGLKAVCDHVVDNALALATHNGEERERLIAFLRQWPPLIVYYLRHIGDPTTAAGLVDHLVHAPFPLDEERALKIMHMLGALPLQLQQPDLQQPARPMQATAEDVALVPPPDVDPKLLEGFFHEAPQQARELVQRIQRLASGEGTSQDLVTARRMVHTLKGSGSIIGLRGLAVLGHHFEDILDHFESVGAAIGASAGQTLLDAAYCLEQMVACVVGQDEAPAQAQAVLQAVLDLARRIDQGEVLTDSSRDISVPAAEPQPSPSVDAQPAEPLSAESAAAPGAAALRGGHALRVSVQQVDELFRVSGEVSVHTTVLETRIQRLAEQARELSQQNLRLQKRLFELETLVDVRALGLLRARGTRVADSDFDPLEMDQYSELHSTTHALMEEAADARTLAFRLEEEIAQLGGVQAQQQRLARDLQHLVIGTRMNQAGMLEPRLQRNVRATCQATGKQATLVVRGGSALIDSDVLNRLAEPLLHLLRNAVDHGIETPQERIAAGKDPVGRIELTFARQGQQVVLRCTDDGRGLDLEAIRRRGQERGLLAPGQSVSDEELRRLILLPGFSTRQTVTEVSGRGVGLDVVREWIGGINGTLDIQSRAGQGCTFELRFAATLATMPALVVQAAQQRFALPSLQVEQAIPRGVGAFERVGDRLIYHHGKRLLQAWLLADLAGLPLDGSRPLQDYDAVLVKLDNQVHALGVDRLIDARELLVKAPGRYARHLRGVAGLSVLGDGSVAVNLDLAQLLASGARVGRVAQRAPALVAAKPPAAAGVLIVDDALSVRNALTQLVQDAGFRVQAARDGIDAIERLRSFDADLVLTDLEMPNMNGLELTSHIRGRQDLRELPVIMITSRSQDKHRRMAEQVGVSRYITKPYSDGELLRTIQETLAA